MDVPMQDDAVKEAGSDTMVTDLTSLENETDEFGRELINYERERSADALQRTPQAFRKARPLPRTALTSENLERVRQDDFATTRSPAPSVPSVESYSGSDRSDPPPNVPRQWGRKSRPRSEWLRHQVATEQEGPRSSSRNRLEALRPRERPSSAPNSLRDVDWAGAAADTPLPLVDDSPASLRAAVQDTPPSIKYRNSPADPNSSLDRIRQWELDEELTANSLLTSTPAPFARNTRLDSIRQREIESVKERAVTTNRLEGIRGGGGDEDARASQEILDSQLGSGDPTSRPWTHPVEQNIQLPKRTERGSARKRPSNTAAGGLNDGPPSPIKVLKSTESVGAVDQGIQANAQSTPRPPHRRDDSRDLLRRLARASSNTPSPQSSARNSAEIKEQDAPRVPPQRSSTDLNGASPTAQKDNRPLRDTPQAIQPPHIDTTQVSEERLPVKTPVVTGAWIDTPRPGTGRSSRFGSEVAGPSTERKSTSVVKSRETRHLRSTSSPPETGHIPLAPPQAKLPSSALAAVLKKSRVRQRKGDDRAYGESTIDSLEDLLSTSPDDTIQLELDEDTLQGLELPPGTPRNEAERERQREILALRSMNDHLRNARSNIRETKREFKRVEGQIERQTDTEIGQIRPTPHLDYCPHCGCPASKLTFSALWVSFKGLFRFRDRNGRRRFTWFGLLFTIFFSWWLTEQVLCEWYCQPLFATHMIGYGINYDAIEQPYVTLTVLFGPLEFLWGPIMRFIVWACEALYNAIVPEEDNPAWLAVGFTPKQQEALLKSMTFTSQAATATRSVVEDWSMGRDQVL